MPLRTTISAIILLAGTVLAAAQTVVITPEQEVVVREDVKANPVVVERPSNFELIVGAIVPDILKPGELAENTLPDRYQYVVVDGRTALIEPKHPQGRPHHGLTGIRIPRKSPDTLQCQGSLLGGPPLVDVIAKSAHPRRHTRPGHRRPCRAHLHGEFPLPVAASIPPDAPLVAIRTQLLPLPESRSLRAMATICHVRICGEEDASGASRTRQLIFAEAPRVGDFVPGVFARRET